MWGRRTIDFATEVFILDWLAALLVWAVPRGHHKKENGPGLVLWQPTSRWKGRKGQESFKDTPIVTHDS